MDWSLTIAAVAFLIGALVGLWKAFTTELRNNTAGVFVILAAACTGLFAVFADKIVVK